MGAAPSGIFMPHHDVSNVRPGIAQVQGPACCTGVGLVGGARQHSSMRISGQLALTHTHHHTCQRLLHQNSTLLPTRTIGEYSRVHRAWVDHLAVKTYCQDDRNRYAGMVMRVRERTAHGNL